MHPFKDERGAAEIIEFLAVVPILIGTALVAVQFVLAAHTAVVSASAAREGARGQAVCDSGWETKARNAAVGYPGAQFQGTNPPSVPTGGQVSVTARLPVPLVLGGVFRTIGLDPPVAAMTAFMRKEDCP